MSFSVTVHRVEDEPPEVPVPTDQDDKAGWAAWHAYAEEMNRITLYAQPLGADGTVYEYWSTIAEDQLGLPMLTSIYQNGLKLQGAEQLEAFRQELDLLENYWNTHELRDPIESSSLRGQLRGHLQERMGYLREAVRIAQEHSAVLTIS